MKRVTCLLIAKAATAFFTCGFDRQQYKECQMRLHWLNYDKFNSDYKKLF